MNERTLVVAELGGELENIILDSMTPDREDMLGIDPQFAVHRLNVN